MRQVGERDVPHDCREARARVSEARARAAAWGPPQGRRAGGAQSPAATHLTRAAGGTIEKMANCAGSQKVTHAATLSRQLLRSAATLEAASSPRSRLVPT